MNMFLENIWKEKSHTNVNTLDNHKVISCFFLLTELLGGEKSNEEKVIKITYRKEVDSRKRTSTCIAGQRKFDLFWKKHWTVLHSFSTSHYQIQYNFHLYFLLCHFFSHHLSWKHFYFHLPDHLKSQLSINFLGKSKLS